MWLAAHHRIARTLRVSAVVTVAVALVHARWAATTRTTPGDWVVITWLIASLQVVVYIVVVGHRAAVRHHPPP